MVIGGTLPKVAMRQLLLKFGDTINGLLFVFIKNGVPILIIDGSIPIEAITYSLGPMICVSMES